MKRNPKIKVRYLVCFSAWFSLLVLYTHRSNISISVLTMIPPKITNMSSPCISSDDSNTGKPPSQAYFSWDPLLTGTVLGCFFYGYASMHFIGGVISARIGPRATLAITLLGSSIAQIISVPLASVSIYAFIFARILSGIFSGPIVPVIHEIVSTWSPPQERTTLAVFTHTGNVFGLIVNYGIGGFIVESSVRGWGHFFYVCGGLGIFALLIWFVCGFDNPFTHPYISDEECYYITNKPRTNDSGVVDTGCIKFSDIPFKEILKSVPAWTCHFGQMASNFLLYGLLTGHPKFLRDVYGFNPTSASLLSMIPFVVSFIVQMVYSRSVDHILKTYKISKTTVRKISSVIGFAGGGLFIGCVGFVRCDQYYVAIILVSLSMACYGANTSGYFTSIIDMAPRYAGVVMGISNTFGSISGIVNPEIVTHIVNSSAEVQSGWKYAFIATGCITFATGFPYLIFGSSELQPWAYHDLADLKKNLSPGSHKMESITQTNDVQKHDSPEPSSSNHQI